MAAFGRAKTVTQPSAPIETLIMDTRVPFFENGHWRFLSQEEHELKKRQLQEPRASSTTSSIAAPNSTATSASTLATSSSVVASTTVSTPDTPISTTPVKPLPSPFDVGLAANFTGNNAACPTFINNFLTDPTFISCYPVSMLLQSSQSFFDAMKSHFETTRVLDHACKADVDACAVYLRRVARNLTSEANCAADYAKGNQMVVKAYVGMMAYQTVYRATCLRDQDTGSYCFANAVDSGSHDAYPYYLPLNLSLPGTAIPSCSECLQQTMAIYQTAAAVRDQPIATTYVSAALQINTICGPDFVSDTLPLPQADPLDSAGARLRQSPSAALAGVLGAAILFGWLL